MGALNHETQTVYRGWKEICALLGVRSKVTARRILEDLGILIYVGGKPAVLKDSVQKALIAKERARGTTEH